MARERTLSPGFFTNHLLANCPPHTRLLFQGIWILADFDGSFLWDPMALAMRLLPRDAFDPIEAMDRLERDGFIRSYEVGGLRFGYVVNWHKYQDPHPGEKPIHPKPSEDPGFMVKIKDLKYRKDGDLGFDLPDLPKGVYPYEQVASKLLASGQQIASKAFPSLPSLPSVPSIPTEVGKVGSGASQILGIPQEGEGPDLPDPQGILENVTVIMDRWDAICLPGSPFTKIRRREDPSLISLVDRCLECPGWEERFGIVVAGVPYLPFYRGEVAPSPEYKKPFVARFAWVVSDPSLVFFHAERIEDQLKELRVVEEATKSGGVFPKASPTWPPSGGPHRPGEGSAVSTSESQAAQLREAMERRRIEHAASKSKKGEATL